MRVMTLGSLPANRRNGMAMVEPEELPSSQSVIAYLRGHRGALTKVAMTTLLRTLLIAPGVWLAGGRGARLWMGAGAASATITTFLFFWYAAQERGRNKALIEHNAPPPGLAPVIDTTAEA